MGGGTPTDVTGSIVWITGRAGLVHGAIGDGELHELTGVAGRVVAVRADQRVWDSAFHGARDVAEMLVAGRERPDPQPAM